MRHKELVQFLMCVFGTLVGQPISRILDKQSKNFVKYRGDKISTNAGLAHVAPSEDIDWNLDILIMPGMTRSREDVEKASEVINLYFDLDQTDFDTSESGDFVEVEIIHQLPTLD
ncbi:hypothetical protein CC78DRAFT_575022 [Lojkania enalia]|uniref:Uncharacterized protein n=1 Tax=Lojkania enalia TaxID=147567 RepID=A0A9P4NAD5_9PLEO|nr:hypothetical protein CC78DRAFT_575022 [Didymosphaeria enalia]